MCEATRVTLAAINHPSCFVVSGSTDNLTSVVEHLKARGILCSPLPVSHAFHSPLIDWARNPLLEAIAGISFHSPHIPIVSCFTEERLSVISGSHLWDCIQGPMNIQKTIQNLEREGPHTYIDLCPSGAFANIVRLNLSPDSQSEIHAAINPFNPRKALFDPQGVLAWL